MKTQTFKSWAIDINEKPYGFIGSRWWRHGKLIKIPVHMEGCVFSLFKTRKLAREALKDMKSGFYVAFPKAKVARVEVTIRSIKR